MEDGHTKKIVELLESKSLLKQGVYDSTLHIFELMKETLHEINSDINDTLVSTRKIKVEYRDRGKFEAQIQVASDMLIYTMHTNIFKFNREHAVYQNDYVKNDDSNSYCGVINIYNFLSDSFKYNRQEDEGYLIARIFVNKNRHFFVEGKRQMKFNHTSFGTRELTEDLLREVIFSTMEYAINFDLLTPPYEQVKLVEVSQMNTKIENSRILTGKRLGYNFFTDDIE